MTAGVRENSRLTREQRAALAVKDRSVALSAGAGCGKTTVLTERFLAEIDGPDGRALRELVALTFTDKAARELRQRIRGECRRRLAEGDAPKRWRTVLRALEAAPVGTFHVFAGRLLRAHAYEIGIDPEFEVLDQTVASSLRDQAVRAAIRRMLADRDLDLTLPASDYGLRQIREALSALLAARTAGELDDWGRLDPAELAARWARAWEDQGRSAVFRGLASLGRCCRDVLSALDAAHPKLQERRADLLQRLSRLEDGTCSESLLEEIRTLARVNDLGAKSIWSDPEAKEAVKRVFESLRKKISSAIEKLATDPATTASSAETSIRMIRLAAQARLEYERLKGSHNGLDFDDLLTRARDLLLGAEDQADGPFTARDAIQFVLVDEFQDTDRVQSEILRRLGDASFFHRRMFVVGDTKQSIYRFRGAEPAIFDDWRGEFPEPGRLGLTENFRSVPGVIHFVNALFGECFTGDPPRQVAGDENRLIARRSAHSQAPAVTFLWALPPAEDGDSETPAKPTVDERRTNEARCLAHWIRDRLDKGWTILDRQTRQTRDAHGGDVALLFRAMTDVWYYEQALADVDLDYHTIGGSAFYAQQEVRDVVSVLSVVEDPLDEVALAAALRSPFFSISDVALFWLARAFEGGLTEGLLRAAEIGELSERDRALAVRAAGLLERWRGLKDRVPLARLVAAILDESGFEAALVCEFLGPRKLANMRKFVRLARDFDRQQGFTLADLVARLRADLDDPPREEQAATTDEEGQAIRLMSIHQAKGLEFPIVVVPDLNRNSAPPQSWLGSHPELGLVVRPPRNPAASSETDTESDSGESQGWRTYRMIEAEEDREESLRLFYVATTRARDHLVLSAGLDGEPDANDPAAAYLATAGSCRGCGQNPANPRANSPAMRLLLERFDWRSGRCLAPLPQGWPSPSVDVVLTTPPECPGRRRGGRPRRTQEVEQAIKSAVVRGPRVVTRPPDRPRLIDLDSDPATPSRTMRLGRLIRAVFADRGLLQGQPLIEVCERLALRQVPVAGPLIQREAVRRLERWLDSSLFEELRVASRAKRAIERDARWTLPWPGSGDGSTLIRGRCDLIYRDRGGSWRPVIVATGETRPGHETETEAETETDNLRLLLSTTAAERLGKVPVGPPWRVQAGPGSSFEVEARLNASLAVINQAIDHWLHLHAAPASAR